jgi:hypothetical protein
MSAFGTQRTCQPRSRMSAFGGIADIEKCHTPAYSPGGAVPFGPIRCAPALLSHINKMCSSGSFTRLLPTYPAP